MEANGKGTVKRFEGLCDEYELLMRRAGFCSAAAASEYARQCCIKASAVAPERSRPYLGLGIVSLQENDLDGARKAFETACRLDERCETGFCGLGIVYQQKGDCQKALSMYCRCLELDGDDMTALLGLLKTSHQTGDLDQIKHFLGQYLARYPDDTVIMLCLASVYLQAEEFDAARRMLVDMLILDPGNVTAVDLLEELDHMKAQDSLDSIREMYPRGFETAHVRPRVSPSSETSWCLSCPNEV